MAKPVAPMPVQTPVIDSKRFELVWERWMKTLSDFAVDAGRVQTINGANYVVSGALVHLEYDGAGGASITLPFAPVGALWVDALVDGAWVKVQASGSTLALPAGDSVHLSTTYIAAISNQP